MSQNVKHPTTQSIQQFRTLHSSAQNQNFVFIIFMEEMRDFLIMELLQVDQKLFLNSMIQFCSAIDRLDKESCLKL